LDQVARSGGFEGVDYRSNYWVRLIRASDNFEGFEMKRIKVVRGLQSVGVYGHIQIVLNERSKSLDFYRAQGF
jgi:hypothetical protein